MGGNRVFGYIRPFDPELRVADLEVYKCVYCGLCRTLSRSYGPLARFVLSYDFTFTTLLHIGLSGRAPDIEPGRCPYKPFTKQPHLRDGPEIHFSAAVAAIMIYYKIIDDITDNGFVKSMIYRCALPFAGRAHKKAAALYPEADAIVAEAMSRQREVEARNDISLDMACEPTAAALADLFGLMAQNDNDRRIMNRLGYMIGRYVYCCDAIADLENDRKTGNFNPLAGEDSDIEAAKSSLYLTQAEAFTAFQLLSISHLEAILGNILTVGMRHTTDTVLQGVKSYEQSL